MIHKNEYGDDTIQKYAFAYMNTILLHKEKSAYFAKKSSRAMNKMMFIRKKLHHWKKIDLESLSTENEGKK